MKRYIAYLTINGYRTAVYVMAETPEQVVDVVKDIFKEIEEKVAELKIADEASGLFIRGYN